MESLLRCEPGNQHLIIFILGGLACAATVVAGAYQLWRWIWPKPPKHCEAAKALRDEAKYRAQLRDFRRAIALYDLSICLNPRAALTYYLRGVLQESVGDLPRAIADWQRSVARLRHNNPAHAKLVQYGAVPGADRTSYGWAYAYGAGGVALLLAFVTVWQFAFLS